MARRHLLALAFFSAAAATLAAEAEYKIVRVEAADHAVNVRLPLTDVTGKVRVKHRAEDGSENPVAPLRTALDGGDYLEWQIGYDTLDPHHPSVAGGIRFQRKGETKYGCELAKILVEARRAGIVTDDQLRRERAFLASALTANLEATAKVVVEKSARPSEPLPAGFAALVEEIPMFTKETPHGRIEIQLKPKQRAVGHQAMVYVCLNVREIRTSAGALRPAGRAHSKETVVYRFDKENVDFLFDIIRAFGIASRQHNADLSAILDCLLAQS